MKENNHTINYSIIVPVYCNEGSLMRTFMEINEKVLKHSSGGELIFVDDGSTDNSLAELLEIKRKYPFIKIIKLTKNFGQISATLAGYRYAKGDCVIYISADLQDPPELMNEMLKNYFDDKYEIVICRRESRDESFFRKITSKTFYSLMNKLNFQDMPVQGFDYVLIGSKVKKYILETYEHNAFLNGQILWTGFKTKFIAYHRKKRYIGKSKWTFNKKLKVFIDGIIGYSYTPIRSISLAGVFVAISGFIYAISIVSNKFFGNIPIKGWAPIMILILVLSGVQMIMLGVIGEYLWRVLDQVRNRPLYIIEQMYD